MVNSVFKQCPQRDHSDRNHDSIPWPESKKGIQFKVFGYSMLPPGMTLAVLASESTSSSSTPSGTGQSSHNRQKKPFSKGKCFDTLIPTSPVRQSNIQLTCYSYRRNCDRTRLRCSLLNCNYTLQVLQQVAINDYKRNGRCISQTVKQGCASVHIVKQQTATFQTYGLGSVHLQYMLHMTY